VRKAGDHADAITVPESTHATTVRICRRKKSGAGDNSCRIDCVPQAFST
jgi:hypothetical protein